MKRKFFDCFMLMNVAFSLRQDDQKLPEISRPIFYESVQTPITLSVLIKTIQILNFKSLEISVELLLNQEWIDPRLKANTETLSKALSGQIWKPNIINIVGQIVYQNDKESFWRGFGDEGHILLVEKLKINIICSENLRKFPFDQQFCEIKFGSYRFPLDEIKIIWASSPVEIEGLSIDGFELKDIKVRSDIDIRRSGNFSIAVIQMIWARIPDYYIFYFILPCLILTFLNYITLWLSKEERLTCTVINIALLFIIIIYHLIVITILTKPTTYIKALEALTMLFTVNSLIILFTNIVCKYLFFNDKPVVHWSCNFGKRINFNRFFKILHPIIYLFCLLIWIKLFL